MDVDAARVVLTDLEDRLQPKLMRAQALERLNELFASGKAPDPGPVGFLAGRPLVVSVSHVVDSVGRRLGDAHMPWLGKSFDREGSRGVNVLTKRARPWMKVVWPSYVPERELADRIEAFPFKASAAQGIVDSGTTVLKIDYDFEPNPDMVRRVVDELVELDDGLYLGKVLFRWQFSYRQVGFFSLGAGGPASDVDV